MGKTSGKQISTLVPLILAACTAVSILSTDFMTPSIPDLPGVFGTDIVTAQYTVSINLAAYALAQLFHGPISDAIGRRRLLLIAFSFFIVFSVFCALAVSIEMLLLGRFLQGLASSVPSVVIVLIIRELYPPKRAVSVMAMYGAALGIAPAIGPLVGSYLHDWFGWSSSFWAIAILASIVAILFAIYVPESLKEKHRIDPAASISTYLSLLGRTKYLQVLLPLSLIFGGFYAFVTTAPVVFIKLLGLPNEHYGLTYMLIIVSFVIGNIFAGRVSKLLTPVQISNRAVLIVLVAGIAMFIPSLLGYDSLRLLLISMCLYAVGLGIIMASGPIALLDTVPDLPQGPASALLGSCQLAAASCAGFLSASFYNESSLSLTATIAGFTVVGCIPLFVRKLQSVRT